MRPHTAKHPCPVCEGHRDLPQGQGRRCWGFTADDGDYAHCTRDDLAGSIAQHDRSEGYPHKLRGECKCGMTHGEAEPTSIGSAKRARIVAVYPYTDEHGTVLFEVVRKEPKSFLQRQPNGAWGRGDARLVPYRLPEVLAAVEAGDRVWICEGERDVEAMRAAGVVATCNAGGAGKWLPEFARYLGGADVTIVADRDEPGRQHARQVFASLNRVARSVSVVQAASGKDAADHLGAGRTVREFVPVYPVDSLREADPVAWKRAILQRSLEVREAPIERVDKQSALEEHPSPVWPTALHGEPTILRAFQGVTFIAGGPSAGKSWWAIASAIDAARLGWHVLYVAAEMSPAQILRRATRYLEGASVPDCFELLEAGYGASAQTLVDEVTASVDERRTLIVLDSISSFVDQAEASPSAEDVHRIGPLKQLTMWALNVRRETNGEVSFLVLSEKNAQGETKGRFGDHKADLVVSITSDPETRLGKRITVTKAWEAETGKLGLFALDPKKARLTWVGE